MDKQKNIALVRNLYDEVFSNGSFDRLDRFFTEDVKLNDPAAPNYRGGIAALKLKEQSYETGFPGKSLKIDDIFTADDGRVVVRWTCTATHKGIFDNIPATNKKIKITGLSIYSFKGDKINEVYQNWDRLGLLEQLGVFEEHLAHR